jgi:hypothetical protein
MFYFSTASFLSKLRAKKIEKLHNSSFYRNFRKLNTGIGFRNREQHTYFFFWPDNDTDNDFNGFGEDDILLKNGNIVADLPMDDFILSHSVFGYINLLYQYFSKIIINKQLKKVNWI